MIPPMTLSQKQRTEPLLLDDCARSGVYGIFNNEAGKIYIGSAVNISRRYRDHLKRLRRGGHHSPHLQRAWDKYGPGAFMFKVLRYVEKGELVRNEQELIDFFQSAWDEAGYNICPTAGSTLGLKHSKQARDKISGLRRGIPLSDEHKAAISLGGKGKRRTGETRQRMKEAQQGYGGGNARLSDSDVFKIRAAAENGVPQKEIGRIFGISRGYVSLVVTRRRWGHL